MANPETDLKNEILLELGQRPDVYIQNTPCGVFRALDSERRVRIGNPGQSDLYAVVAVTITPDMVGQTVGVAWFPEVKTARGSQQDNQKLFAHAVTRRGAEYSLIRSVEQALEALRKIQRRP